MLTQEYLKSVLHYSPDTGVFTNMVTRSNRAVKGKIASSVNVQGYLRIGILGKTYLAHRLVWLYMYGEFPTIIDHINGNKVDNRLENLRECTASQNLHNREKPSSNTSGYKGVYKYKKTDRFYSQIMLNGKGIHLGIWDSAKDAHNAYKKASDTLLGEFSIYQHTS